MLVPILFLVALVAGPGLTHSDPAGHALPVLELENSFSSPAPFPVPWTPGHKTRTDWAAIIDATWGPGHPAATQFDVFDTFWNWVDQRFACFHDIEDNWQELHDQYVDEVTAGVSRGRFAGILGQLSLSLRESHTKAYDQAVRDVFAGRGVPLLFTHGLARRAGMLGAAVTAQSDGTGLVYRTLDGNPLGLQPGDRIVGYDGRPWSECLAELLAAELPVSGYWGCSPESWEHHWTAAVGTNWHLFDTMDVVAYATGDTLHLATSAIGGYYGELYASDQLDVGIPFPDWVGGEPVTWGVIDRGGEEIGYIYVFGWSGTAGTDFYAAVDDLTTNYDTAGLIVDFRKNAGGNMFLSDAALGLLFAEDMPTIDWVVRCSPVDHLTLCRQNAWPVYVIDSDPQDRHYDRPIAVLTGPGAVSSGDQVALRMTYHPFARSFGKSTAAAFNSPEDVPLPSGFSGRNAHSDAVRLDDLEAPLTHLDFPVDVPVWLAPEDVALGIDTVVEAAVSWIVDVTVAVDSGPPSAPVARFVGASPNPFNPTTQLVVSLDRATDGELEIFDLAGRRVRTFPLRGFRAGEHRVAWDGRSDAGFALASGTYVVRLSAAGDVDVGRVALVK